MAEIPPYLQWHVRNKLISVSPHPQYNLWVCNYTPEAQYSAHWDEITLTHRGLVVEEEGQVVSMCLPKFFNYEEHEAYEWLPNVPIEQSFEVFEKLDGSYISVRNHPLYDNLIVASRGSFTSDHAAWATEIIQENRWDFDPDFTYIFELIHPENRIVVDYGNYRDLVLLEILDDEGVSIPYEDHAVPFETARRYKCSDLKLLLEQDLPAYDREGYVVRFKAEDSTPLRVKVKLRDYVKVHSLIYGLSKKELIEHARNESIDEIMRHVPAGFDWIKDAVGNLSNYARLLRDSAQVIANEVEAMKANPRTEYETIMNLDGVSLEIKHLAVAKLRNSHPDKVEDSVWKHVKNWTKDKTVEEISKVHIP